MWTTGASGRKLSVSCSSSMSISSGFIFMFMFMFMFVADPGLDLMYTVVGRLGETKLIVEFYR